MKLYNLTDIATPALTSRGLVNVPISIKGTSISPGDSVEIAGVSAADIRTYVLCGALSEELPLAYKMAKMKLTERKPRPHLPPSEPRPPIGDRLSVDGSDRKRKKKRK